MNLHKSRKLEDEIYKSLLKRLDKPSFSALITEFDKSENAHEPYTKISETIFYTPLLDSYGGSVHSVSILKYFPFELLKRIEAYSFNDIEFLNDLSIVANHYKGQKGHFGMVSPFLRESNKLENLLVYLNIDSQDQEFYQRYLFPKLNFQLEKFELNPRLFLGSYGSLIDNKYDSIKEFINSYLTGKKDGLSISIGGTGNLEVDHYYSEKYLTAGLLPNYSNPLDSKIKRPRGNQEIEVFKEFEALINSDTKENTLENFLQKHYRLIFGFQYDFIKTQVWLKFPEFDLGKKNRRLDIFLRNGLNKDWELVELKRADIRLTRTYRDIPVLTSEINTSISQLKNYDRILRQSNVKETLRTMGIEYFEPELKLVVGRTPSIPIDQWRIIKKENENNLKLITYDDILNESRLRYEQYQKIFDK